ncbi:MAG: flagellar hook-basal body complex protein FliE [Oligoflexia bacterium]|nr:flagellar hook-basal body complex protein FliE [Oligoflexia bacterium]
MSIDGIKLGLQSIAPIKKPLQSQEAPAINSDGKNSFSQMFTDALKEANRMQNEANNQIEGMVLGKDGVTTHGAMIALEKADIAFQLMTTIRSKIIRAYEEVIRTQV